MHEIQRGILKKLTFQSILPYATLKPQGVESNRFVYHLNEVRKFGYIQKTKNGYRLTAAGKRYADRVSLEKFEERVQPKIVTLIACKNKQGQFLLYRRKRQPFSGKIGFPYGKIHLGEKIADAVARELHEKAGLRAQLVHRGDVYITVYDNAEVVTHMLCHVFFGDRPEGTLTPQSSIGEFFWEYPRAVRLTQGIPGFREIARLLGKNGSGRFFAEYFLDVATPAV